MAVNQAQLQEIVDAIKLGYKKTLIESQKIEPDSLELSISDIDQREDSRAIPIGKSASSSIACEFYIKLRGKYITNGEYHHFTTRLSFVYYIVNHYKMGKSRLLAVFTRNANFTTLDDYYKDIIPQEALILMIDYLTLGVDEVIFLIDKDEEKYWYSFRNFKEVLSNNYTVFYSHDWQPFDENKLSMVIHQYL